VTDVRRRVLLTAALLGLAATCAPAQDRVAAILRGAVGQVSDSASRASLERLYGGWSWRMLWMGRQGPLARADSLLAWIDRSAADGLDPDAYDAAGIRALWRLPGDSVLAVADERLSEAFLRLGHDLSAGRVVPARVDSLWTGAVTPPNVVAVLDEAVRRDDVSGALASLRPRAADYAALRQVLARYRVLAARGGWPLVPAGPDLGPGDSGTRVAILRARLALTDGPIGGTDSARFDDELVRAVRRFQSRHGLPADAVVGPETRAALNVPVARRIATLELNLERWRWVPRTVGLRYVLVNIPAFRLELHDSGRVQMSVRAIVGRKDWPTPITTAWMDGITFRPEWNVPPRIALQEILPLERAHPGYLGREGFRVISVDGGTPVDPDSVNWVTVDTARFPYRLVQEPGPDNPLGALRFVVADPFNVAIHDTPQRALFGDRVRLFSHGCVRVDSAALLAVRLLPGWSADDVRNAMRGDSSRTVGLPRRLRVLLTYETAWVDAEGVVQFRDDIYAWDDELAAALAGIRVAAVRAAPGEDGR